MDMFVGVSEVGFGCVGDEVIAWWVVLVRCVVCVCDRKGHGGSGKGKEYDVFWTVGRAAAS